MSSRAKAETEPPTQWTPFHPQGLRSDPLQFARKPPGSPISRLKSSSVATSVLLPAEHKLNKNSRVHPVARTVAILSPQTITPVHDITLKNSNAEEDDDDNNFYNAI
jgi:hypothetical protein